MVFVNTWPIAWRSRRVCRSVPWRGRSSRRAWPAGSAGVPIRRWGSSGWSTVPPWNPFRRWRWARPWWPSRCPNPNVPAANPPPHRSSPDRSLPTNSPNIFKFFFFFFRIYSPIHWIHWKSFRIDYIINKLLLLFKLMMNLSFNWIYFERIDHLYQSFIANHSELIKLITIYYYNLSWWLTWILIEFISKELIIYMNNSLKIILNWLNYQYIFIII